MDDENNYHGRRTAEELVEAIDASYAAEDRRKPPKYIKPSTIGAECGRAPQLDFYWASPVEAKPGRIIRLFGTGNRIETELVGDLKRIGWEVIDKDPNDARKQISLTALKGHLFGYVDGIGRDREVSGEWCILEMKSHKAESFRKVVKRGVAAVKIEHYAQLQLYLHEFKLKLGLYVAKNKDSDEIHTEWIPYDESYCTRLLEKGMVYVDKQTLLPKISQKADYFICRFCPHQGVCHEGRQPQRSCRTCEHSKPVDGGVWACTKFNCLLTDKELVKVGCKEYRVAELFGVASNEEDS